MRGNGSADTTLVDILLKRTAQNPEETIFTFLQDGEVESGRLTYSQLDRKARAVGAWLQSRLPAGERVLLLFQPGLEFVAAYFGCLYAGMIAVPVYPPRHNRNLQRLRAVVADARAAAALTTTPVLDMVARGFADALDLAALTWLAVDAMPDGLEAEWRDQLPKASDLAFLQYTSGSSGAPKGVEVTHGNLVHNIGLLYRATGCSPQTRMVTWLPTFHDMGLIGFVLFAVQGGIPCVMMAPAAFLQKPIRWLKAIAQNPHTYTGAPNFAYDLCCQKVRPEEIAELDLSQWDVTINGAEPVRAETLDRFTETFAPCGFRRDVFFPGYGMAEATLFISGRQPWTPPVTEAFDKAALERNVAIPPTEAADARQLVSCGTAHEDQQLRIVDPDTCIPCPAGTIGEIWVQGPSVAHGYWERPEESERIFRATVAGTGEGPFLRTGDLGFIGPNGDVFVTGRAKDLIILRGRNLYPQDIEAVVEQSHPGLIPSCCAAFAVEGEGTEQLVVVQEVHRHQKDLGPVFGAIREAVAEEFEASVQTIVLVRQGTIPKTSSGKIQRRPSRAMFLAGELDEVGRWQAAAEANPLPVDATASAAPAQAGPGVAAIRTWLIEEVARTLKLSPGQIDPRKSFAYFGIDSVAAVHLAGELERWLGRTLPATLLWDYPSIERLARYLAGESDDAVAADAAAVAAEPIAIVGIGCRFPGADGPAAFWRLLCEGTDAISEVPPERWDAEALYSRDPLAPGKLTTKWGGFLPQVDQFDPDFFAISRREAAQMDPQQRLLLEVAWEALEDAGQVREHLAGSRTGVFVGVSTSDYMNLQAGDLAGIDAYTGTGIAHSIAANRISYWLDLRGPSIAVDTACSSALVAMHLACQSIRSGECAQAIVGGVNVILSPAVGINFSKAGTMAADGRCKAFDASADGFVRGEGAGVVMLKPLSRALADGDQVYAVIRGGAVNQDGHSNGLMAPNGQAHETLLRDACRNAGVAPGDVDYVETQGTGSKLGDPIEVLALGRVLSEGRTPDRPCRIGSVKTNIGHLEAASGIAGVIKTALSLKHRVLPPSLHFNAPNPHIPFDALLIRVQQELSAWPESGRPALAGVSAFGFGGTNCHLVLEEAPAAVRHADDAHDGKPHLLVMSAHTPAALQALAQSYAAWPQAGEAPLADICYTAARRRTHHDCRLAVVAASASELQAKLAGFVQSGEQLGVSFGNSVAGATRRAVFVFPDQGSHWRAMSRDLLGTEPAFRRVSEECDRLFRDHAPWSLLSELTAPAGESRVDETGLTQPALFAVQIALAEVWRSWGIEPAAVMGHGLGEVSAAYVAGALSLADAVRVAFHRGRVMQQAAGKGETAAAELEQALAGLRPGMAKVPVYSSVTGGPVSGEFDAAYWGRTLREPARFSDVMQGLVQEEYDTFLEVSPHEAGRQALLSRLGTLYTSGYPVNWRHVYPVGALVRLPAYPYQRERCWFADGAAVRSGEGRRTAAVPGSHPLLGSQVDIAPVGHTVWEQRVALDQLSRLWNHSVHGEPVLPDAAYLEMARAAGHQVFGAGEHALTAVTFDQPLFLSAEGGCVLQFVLADSSAHGEAAFRIYSRPAEKQGPAAAWICHATGRIVRGQGEQPEAFGAPVGHGRLLDQVAAAAAPDGLALLESYVTDEVARALRMPIARLNPNAPLMTLGLDSLTGFELKNRMERDLSTQIPLGWFLQGSSANELAAMLHGALTMARTQATAAATDMAEQPRPAAAPLDPTQAAALLEGLDQLSDDEVHKLLQEMMDRGGNEP